MNKVEVIKGIEETIKGLEHIKTALCEVEKVVPFPSNDVKVEKAEAPTSTENNATVVGKFDVEQLNAMKYNEFKKLASSLGVKCTGTRDEIMERILALDVVVDNGEAEVVDAVEEADTTEEVVEEAPKKVEKKKIGKKSAEVAPKDEFDIQAEEVAKETDVEDIIEALADVGVEANKKNAVSLLANALREGLIELEEDEEDEEEEVVEAEIVEDDEDDTDGDEITSSSYFSQFDPKGFNNPEEMTEERAEAITSKVEEIVTAYSEGELTDEDIASYVEDNATEDEIDLLGEEYTEEDILKLYIELVKRTIDNDGEEHEQGEPYEVADKDVCCGHELRYSKKTSKYICEHCGTEYEAE